jgi:DNA-binding transcriptional regulator YiaG
MTPEEFREIRKSAGMTQAQLADWLHCTPLHVSHTEGGRRPITRTTELAMLFLKDLVSSGVRVAAYGGI